jgi:hypothetical protein
MVVAQVVIDFVGISLYLMWAIGQNAEVIAG